MSTRASLVCGDGVHFFVDVSEEVWNGSQDVYLSLPDDAFEKDDNGETVVRIPAHVWAAIRETHDVTTDYADTTDEEILAVVTKYVDDRIKTHRAKKKSVGMGRLAGWIPYGDPADPRAEQIQRGVEHETKRRDEQRQIRDRIVALRVFGVER